MTETKREPDSRKSPAPHDWTYPATNAKGTGNRGEKLVNYAAIWTSYDAPLGDLIPIPANTKKLDKAGFTGAHGRAVTDEDRRAWAGERGNVILHVSDEVIGIDIDDYSWTEDGVLHRKNGFADQDALAEALGLPLPRTWTSTGRDPGDDPLHVSGIKFYRVPKGFVANMDRLAGNIELVTHGYRYAVVWPSRVKDAKGDRVYQWYRPGESVPADRPPRLDELTPLPQVYLDLIANPATAPQKFGRVPDLAPEDVDATYARGHCQQVLASVRADLEECVPLDEGVPNSHGDTWEKAVANAARNIWRMVWTPGSKVYGYPSHGLALFLETVPPEMQADGLTYSALEKWEAEEEPTHRDKGPLMVLTSSQRAALDFTAEKPLDQSEVSVSGVAGRLPDRFDPLAKTPAEMARVIASTVRRCYRFALDEQCWYRYRAEEHRWAPEAATMLQVARNIIERLSCRMSPGDPDADKGTPLYQQHKRYQMLVHPQQRGALAKMVVDVVSEVGFYANRMDSDPDVIWAGDRCWDLRTGELASGVDPWAPHAATCAVAPEAGPFPRFQALLDAAIPAAHQAYAWQLFGHMLTGHNARVIPYMYGEKGSGKSTLMECLMDVFGIGYAAPLQEGTLNASDGQDFLMLALRGARLAWLDEGVSNQKRAVERLKMMSGGGTVQASVKNARLPVTFRQTHTLVITSNREPLVTDAAVRSRIKPLHFMPESGATREAADDVYRDRAAWLREEGPAILARAMASAGELLRNDLIARIPVPEDLAAEIGQWAREQNPVADFLNDQFDPDGEKERYGLANLYEMFKLWAANTGSYVPNRRDFGKELTHLGVEDGKSHGNRYRLLARKPYDEQETELLEGVGGGHLVRI